MDCTYTYKEEAGLSKKDVLERLNNDYNDIGYADFNSMKNISLLSISDVNSLYDVVINNKTVRLDINGIQELLKQEEFFGLNIADIFNGSNPNIQVYVPYAGDVDISLEHVGFDLDVFSKDEIIVARNIKTGELEANTVDYFQRNTPEGKINYSLFKVIREDGTVKHELLDYKYEHTDENGNVTNLKDTVEFKALSEFTSKQPFENGLFTKEILGRYLAYNYEGIDIDKVYDDYINGNDIIIEGEIIDSLNDKVSNYLVDFGVEKITPDLSEDETIRKRNDFIKNLNRNKLLDDIFLINHTSLRKNLLALVVNDKENWKVQPTQAAGPLANAKALGIPKGTKITDIEGISPDEKIRRLNAFSFFRNIAAEKIGKFELLEDLKNLKNKPRKELIKELNDILNNESGNLEFADEITELALIKFKVSTYQETDEEYVSATNQIEELHDIIKGKITDTLTSDLVDSYFLSKVSFGSRIPSQGKQSSHVFETSIIDDSRGNVIMTSMLRYMAQGQDDDGDKLNVFSVELDKLGRYIKFDKYVNKDGSFDGIDNSFVIDFYDKINEKIEVLFSERLSKEKVLLYNEYVRAEPKEKAEIRSKYDFLVSENDKNTILNKELDLLKINDNNSESEILNSFIKEIDGKYIEDLNSIDITKGNISNIEEYTRLVKRKNSEKKSLIKNYNAALKNYILEEHKKAHLNPLTAIEKDTDVEAKVTKKIADGVSLSEIDTDQNEDDITSSLSTKRTPEGPTSASQNSINVGNSSVGQVANMIKALGITRLLVDKYSDNDTIFKLNGNNNRGLTLSFREPYVNKEGVVEYNIKTQKLTHYKPYLDNKLQGKYNDAHVEDTDIIDYQERLKQLSSEEANDLTKTYNDVFKIKELLAKEELSAEDQFALIAVFHKDEIWSELSEFLTLAVDNAKLLLLDKLGLDTTTLPIVLNAMDVGFDLKHVLSFFKQRKIKSIIDKSRFSKIVAGKKKSIRLKDAALEAKRERDVRLEEAKKLVKKNIDSENELINISSLYRFYTTVVKENMSGYKTNVSSISKDDILAETIVDDTVKLENNITQGFDNNDIILLRGDNYIEKINNGTSEQDVLLRKNIVDNFSEENIANNTSKIIYYITSDNKVRLVTFNKATDSVVSNTINHSVRDLAVLRGNVYVINNTAIDNKENAEQALGIFTRNENNNPSTNNASLDFNIKKLSNRIYELDQDILRDNDSLKSVGYVMEHNEADELIDLLDITDENSVLLAIVSFKNAKNNSTRDMNQFIHNVNKKVETILNRDVSKKGKKEFDVLRFFNDTTYATGIAAYYENKRIGLNPFTTIMESPELFTSLKSLVVNENLIRVTQKKPEVIDHFIKKLYRRDTDRYYDVKSAIESVQVGDYLDSLGGYSSFALNSNGETIIVDLKSIEGRDAFLREFPSYVASLKKTSDNTFIQSINPSSYKSKGEVSFMELKRGTMDKISVVRASFNEIENADLKKAFILYDLIVNKNNIKKDSLNNAFGKSALIVFEQFLSSYDMKKLEGIDERILLLSSKNLIEKADTDTGIRIGFNDKITIGYTINGKKIFIPLEKVGVNQVPISYVDAKEKLDIDQILYLTGYRPGEEVLYGDNKTGRVVHYDSKRPDDSQYLLLDGTYVSKEDLLENNPLMKFRERDFGKMTNEEINDKDFDRGGQLKRDINIPALGFAEKGLGEYITYDVLGYKDNLPDLKEGDYLGKEFIKGNSYGIYVKGYYRAETAKRLFRNELNNDKRSLAYKLLNDEVKDDVVIIEYKKLTNNKMPLRESLRINLKNAPSIGLTNAARNSAPFFYVPESKLEELGKLQGSSNAFFQYEGKMYILENKGVAKDLGEALSIFGLENTEEGLAKFDSLFNYEVDSEKDNKSLFYKFTRTNWGTETPVPLALISLLPVDAKGQSSAMEESKMLNDTVLDDSYSKMLKDIKVYSNKADTLIFDQKYSAEIKTSIPSPEKDLDVVTRNKIKDNLRNDIALLKDNVFNLDKNLTDGIDNSLFEEALNLLLSNKNVILSAASKFKVANKNDNITVGKPKIERELINLMYKQGKTDPFSWINEIEGLINNLEKDNDLGLYDNLSKRLKDVELLKKEAEALREYYNPEGNTMYDAANSKTSTSKYQNTYMTNLNDFYVLQIAKYLEKEFNYKTELAIHNSNNIWYNYNYLTGDFNLSNQIPKINTSNNITVIDFSEKRNSDKDNTIGILLKANALDAARDKDLAYAYRHPMKGDRIINANVEIDADDSVTVDNIIIKRESGVDRELTNVFSVNKLEGEYKTLDNVPMTLEYRIPGDNKTKFDLSKAMNLDGFNIVEYDDGTVTLENNTKEVVYILKKTEDFDGFRGDKVFENFTFVTGKEQDLVLFKNVMVTNKTDFSYRNSTKGVNSKLNKLKLDIVSSIDKGDLNKNINTLLDSLPERNENNEINFLKKIANATEVVKQINVGTFDTYADQKLIDNIVSEYKTVQSKIKNFNDVRKEARKNNRSNNITVKSVQLDDSSETGFKDVKKSDRILFKVTGKEVLDLVFSSNKQMYPDLDLAEVKELKYVNVGKKIEDTVVSNKSRILNNSIRSLFNRYKGQTENKAFILFPEDITTDIYSDITYNDIAKSIVNILKSDTDGTYKKMIDDGVIVFDKNAAKAINGTNGYSSLADINTNKIYRLVGVNDLNSRRVIVDLTSYFVDSQTSFMDQWNERIGASSDNTNINYTPTQESDLYKKNEDYRQEVFQQKLSEYYRGNPADLRTLLINLKGQNVFFPYKDKTTPRVNLEQAVVNIINDEFSIKYLDGDKIDNEILNFDVSKATDIYTKSKLAESGFSSIGNNEEGVMLIQGQSYKVKIDKPITFSENPDLRDNQIENLKGYVDVDLTKLQKEGFLEGQGTNPLFIVSLTKIENNFLTYKETGVSQKEVLRNTDYKFNKNLGEQSVKTLATNTLTLNIKKSILSSNNITGYLSEFTNEFSNSIDLSSMNEDSVLFIKSTPIGEDKNLPLNVYETFEYISPLIDNIINKKVSFILSTGPTINEHIKEYIISKGYSFDNETGMYKINGALDTRDSITLYKVRQRKSDTSFPSAIEGSARENNYYGNMPTVFSQSATINNNPEDTAYEYKDVDKILDANSIASDNNASLVEAVKNEVVNSINNKTDDEAIKTNYEQKLNAEIVYVKIAIAMDLFGEQIKDSDNMEPDELFKAINDYLLDPKNELDTNNYNKKVEFFVGENGVLNNEIKNINIVLDHNNTITYLKQNDIDINTLTKKNNAIKIQDGDLRKLSNPEFLLQKDDVSDILAGEISFMDLYMFGTSLSLKTKKFNGVKNASFISQIFVENGVNGLSLGKDIDGNNIYSLFDTMSLFSDKDYVSAKPQSSFKEMDDALTPLFQSIRTGLKLSGIPLALQSTKLHNLPFMIDDELIRFKSFTGTESQPIRINEVNKFVYRLKKYMLERVLNEAGIPIENSNIFSERGSVYINAGYLINSEYGYDKINVINTLFNGAKDDFFLDNIRIGQAYKYKDDTSIITYIKDGEQEFLDSNMQRYVADENGELIEIEGGKEIKQYSTIPNSSARPIAGKYNDIMIYNGDNFELISGDIHVYPNNLNLAVNESSGKNYKYNTLKNSYSEAESSTSDIKLGYKTGISEAIIQDSKDENPEYLELNMGNGIVARLRGGIEVLDNGKTVKKGTDIYYLEENVWKLKDYDIKFKSNINKVSIDNKTIEAKKVDKQTVTRILSFFKRKFPNTRIETHTSRELKALGLPSNRPAFVINGAMLFNTDLITLDSPIHEFGHLYLKYIKDTDMRMYNSIIAKALSQKALVNDVIANEPELTDLKDIGEEVFVTALGFSTQENFLKEIEDETSVKKKSIKDFFKDLITWLFGDNKTVKDYKIDLDKSFNDIIKELGNNIVFADNSAFSDFSSYQIKSINNWSNKGKVNRAMIYNKLVNQGFIRTKNKVSLYGRYSIANNLKCN